MVSKAVIGFIFFVFFNIKVDAQTNTFPTSGNVGIGTTNPGHKLEVAGDIGIGANGTLGSGVNWACLGCGANSTVQLYDPVNGSMLFNTEYPSSYYAFSHAGSEKVRFDNKGNVGIGTTTPGHKLEVAGDIGIGANGTLGSGINWGCSGCVSNSTIQLYDPINGSMLFNTEYASSYYAFSHAGSEKVRIDKNGNVGIGTISPSEKLSVNGNIRSKKLIVTQTNWSDYVFDSSYQLKPLTEVEQFIKTNKHLPDMPSAKEVEKEGIDVGGNQALLLKKIEELTLYMIEMKRENKEIKRDNAIMKQKMELLQKNVFHRN